MSVESESVYPSQMAQYAPYPVELEKLVGRLKYRPGWRFALRDVERDPEDTHSGSAGGLTFEVYALTMDAYHANLKMQRYTRHLFVVPAATYNAIAWLEWIGQCLDLIEQHERCEFMRLGNGDSYEFNDEDMRPFAPLHGPGDNPYVVHHLASDLQRRTSWQGVVKGS